MTRPPVDPYTSQIVTTAGFRHRSRHRRTYSSFRRQIVARLPYDNEPSSSIRRLFDYAGFVIVATTRMIRQTSAPETVFDRHSRT